MRLAWFRPEHPGPRASLDETAALIDTLRRTHDIRIVTVSEAHDFVWKHDREPDDLCVFELGRTPAHAFVWPYLLHYPGVVLLRRTTMADARGWGRSRVIVVADPAVAQSLGEEWPAARMRVAPLGADAGRELTPGVISGPDGPRKSDPVSFPGSGGLTLGVLDGARRDVVDRALERARRRGASAAVLADAAPEIVLQHADVIVALEWPPAAGPPAAALHAMAAGLPAIVLEVEATAGWPALDPQTWLPRGFSTDRPIAVSIDPRDEEHSLMLAIARLAADVRLREALGVAGRTWWRAHATVDQASAAFERILREAVTLGPASPEHVADGSENARAVLAEFGLEVDSL